MLKQFNVHKSFFDIYHSSYSHSGHIRHIKKPRTNSISRHFEVTIYFNELFPQMTILLLVGGVGAFILLKKDDSFYYQTVDLI